MRLVIIGGDAAGMSAASQAKRQDRSAEVIVLEKTRDVSYGACGLPYKLPCGQKMEDLQVVTVQDFREKRGIDVRLEHRVTAIDPATKSVSGATPSGPFTLSYDRLIIATGARAIRPPIEGLDALWGEGAYPLKTLEDGRNLKATLMTSPPRQVVIIGGGYIGLEASEGLHALDAEVTILEALPHIVPFLPEALRARIYDEAEAHGVTIRCNTLVKSVSRRDYITIAVETSDGVLDADLVVVATGVRPESELAAAAGIELGAANAIAVDDTLRTSVPDVFAAGDCADSRHRISGMPVWVPLALRANRGGKVAGANAVGGERKAPPIMGTAVFKFFGLEIARTGLTEAEARESGFDPVTATIQAPTRAHYYPGGGKLSVWLLGDRKSGRLLGGAMVGPEAAAHKIDTLVAALDGGMTPAQLYDLDLAYAPPFGPSWSPLLTAASALMKAMRSAAR